MCKKTKKNEKGFGHKNIKTHTHTHNLVSFKVKHLLSRAGEVSSTLTSDRLDSVTKLKRGRLHVLMLSGEHDIFLICYTIKKIEKKKSKYG